MFMHESLSPVKSGMIRSYTWQVDRHSFCLSLILKTNSCEGERRGERDGDQWSHLLCWGLFVSARRRQQVRLERRGVMEFRKWCKANRRECARQFVRREEVLIEMSDSQRWLGNICVVGGMQRSDISRLETGDHPHCPLSPWGSEISGKSSRSHSAFWRNNNLAQLKVESASVTDIVLKV